MQKKCAGFHPKVPDGPQRCGKQRKKQHGPAQRAQQHIAPQDPLGPAQREEKQRAAEPRAVDGVQWAGQAGAALPQRPQQIV